MASSGESRARAHEQAQAALSAIAEHHLIPSPQNYTVWFSHLSGSHPELSRTIEGILESGQVLDESTCAALYVRFFSLAALEGTVADAGERMSSELSGLADALSTMHDESDAYDAVLLRSIALLKGGERPEDAPAVLDNIVAATRRMNGRRDELTQRLTTAEREIAELRASLETARSEALTDPLTGVENRRSLDLFLDRLISEAGASRSPLSLLICDIDHFKMFNDTHGHDTGDLVLRLVAETLKRCTKGRDVVARFGGEEFVVLLPDTTAKHAETVANQICREMATKELVRRRDGRKLGRITVSIGGTEYQPGEAAQSLLQRADTCLYSAKRAGRNRVLFS